MINIMLSRCFTKREMWILNKYTATSSCFSSLVADADRPEIGWFFSKLFKALNRLIHGKFRNLTVMKGLIKKLPYFIVESLTISSTSHYQERYSFLLWKIPHDNGAKIIQINTVCKRKKKKVEQYKKFKRY